MNHNYTALFFFFTTLTALFVGVYLGHSLGRKAQLNELCSTTEYVFCEIDSVTYKMKE